jgi:hypothetical protein
MAKDTGENRREEVLDVEADKITLRAIYDRVATARAALLQQSRQMEMIMNWLQRKKQG